jgi:hypothetical protein
VQLESAAANVLARFHHVEEDGQEQDFTGLQVLLHSTKQFGPTSLRELSVSGPTSAHTLPPFDPRARIEMQFNCWAVALRFATWIEFSGGGHGGREGR